MQVDISSPSSVERKVVIRVPAERLAEERQKVITDLSKYAQIKGFRKGKAPVAVIERLYGSAILDEVRQRILRDTVEKAFDENKLQPISQPVVDAKEPELGRDYEFSIQFEVKPEFEVKNYTGIEITQKAEAVTDDDVAKTLENLRQQHAILVPNEADQTLGTGLFFVGSYTGTIGEKEVSSGGKDVEIEIGASGQLPGLSDKLEGMKTGETRLVELTVPADWGSPDIQGKTYKVTFTCNAIKRRVLPTLDDEFAKDLEMESMDALRKKVREDMEAAAASRARNEAVSKLLDRIVEQNPVDVPPSLVESQSMEYIQRTYAQFQMQGLKMQPRPEELEKMKESVREDSTKAVRRSLVLLAIAEKEKLEATDTDVEAEVARRAESAGVPADKLRAYLDKEGALSQIRGQLIEKKVIDFLMEKSKVTV
ncbi:MAG: trigger factor [Deltaproteobacteria bacterium]|nr:trigger factor [Deltaproteobacteria bacterium]